ncbi:hypothetical protein Ssi02_11540 [Sinosporangium siamense]|uniref:Uncharacterized protein n=2 Tax=Sinosporangium siamense TaxID=1367973 RepID=A0A919RC38_9ACTN|nr:hypothetical protein Ssi02_11540 [Sinosporangium siamense]
MAWIVSGGAIALSAVLLGPIIAWFEVRPGYEDYDTGTIVQKGDERTTSVYRLTAPRLVVKASDDTNVTIARGKDGEMTVDRRVVWEWDRPNVMESWDGGTLILDFECPHKGRRGADKCRADVTVSVPDIPITRLPV